MRTGWSIAGAFARDTGGNVATIFGLSLLPLITLGGSALDYSRATTMRGHLQAALDAAVLGGIAQPADRRAAVAGRIFTAMAGSMTTAVPAFQTTGDGAFSGSVSAGQPTSFLNLVGINSIDIAVNAVARQAITGGAPVKSVCLLLLDPDANNAFTVNGGATINAPDCEIHVRSTGKPAAIFNGGSTLNVNRVCIRGTAIQNGGSVAPVNTGCAAASDPFAGTLPAPASTACQYNGGNYNGGSVALQPGVYCGHMNFNGSPSVTFAPGVYVIKNGGWNVNGGTWKGSGVTFYFPDESGIQFNGNMTTDLTAPASGPQAGILFYEASGLRKSQWVFNGSKDHRLEGLIYLPSRNVTFNSNSRITSDKITMVYNQMIINTSEWGFQTSSKPIAVPGASGGATVVRTYLER